MIVPGAIVVCPSGNIVIFDAPGANGRDHEQRCFKRHGLYLIIATTYCNTLPFAAHWGDKKHWILVCGENEVGWVYSGYMDPW